MQRAGIAKRAWAVVGATVALAVGGILTAPASQADDATPMTVTPAQTATPTTPGQSEIPSTTQAFDGDYVVTAESKRRVRCSRPRNQHQNRASTSVTPTAPWSASSRRWKRRARFQARSRCSRRTRGGTKIPETTKSRPEAARRSELPGRCPSKPFHHGPAPPAGEAVGASGQGGGLRDQQREPRSSCVGREMPQKGAARRAEAFSLVRRGSPIPPRPTRRARVRLGRCGPGHGDVRRRGGRRDEHVRGHERADPAPDADEDRPRVVDHRERHRCRSRCTECPRCLRRTPRHTPGRTAGRAEDARPPLPGIPFRRGVP